MRWLPGFLLVIAAPSCLIAQKTEADLRARLVNQPLYLRGHWSGDTLAFDDAGQLQGTSAPVAFTLAGVDVESVKLTAKELVLSGQRVGLEFEKDVPKRVGLMVREGLGEPFPEKMTIRIQAPADGDFTAALDAIFADNLAELVPLLPSYWRQFADGHLLPGADASAVARAFHPEKLARIGGGVTQPRLLTHVDPQFGEAARAMKYNGVVLVNFVLDDQGKPTRFQILHPVGLGLDEEAVAAVSQYTFQPAMENGVPVAVELNVEVNFRIF
ncbi:MAG: energy transducer TonB [Acidobacteriaceae bacterium]|jgi:TonB family protein